MVITIDGPAGAGKSSVARGLAQCLGCRFLDTGAMYRAVAWAAMHANIPWEQADQIADLAGQLNIQLTSDRVVVNGRDVTREIRESAVTTVIHHVADNPSVREELVNLQRREAAKGDIVTEGRDQGTIVFPDAECKIFLTASAEERARRGLRDVVSSGEEATFDEVLEQQNLRDKRDRSRPVGALVPAADAIEVTTDGMSPDQVLDRLESIVREKR